MDLLRKWRDAQVPSSAAPPAAVRVRALTGGPAPARRRAGTPRLAWSLGLSAGLAVAVLGGVVWAQGVPGSGTTAARSPSAQPPSAGAQVLLAAAQALPQNPVVPRPDQFLYTQSYVLLGMNGGPEQRQDWTSIDGTRDGLLTIGPATGTGRTRNLPDPGCHDGRRPLVRGDKVIPGKYESMPCVPAPAFRPNLPTDPAAMLTWLSNWRAFADVPADQATAADQPLVAFNNASHLLSQYYLTAPMQAAVFNALAQLPGITVHEDVVDPAGRHGIGVSASQPSAPPAATPSDGPKPEYKYLVFNRDSHAFLGTSIFALLRQSLVDNAGQLPS